jgi:hypothetical protein
MIDIKSETDKSSGYKDDLVCFCFGYTATDIERDFFDNNGESTILKRITFEKVSGNCDCARKNPKGI